MVEVREVYYTDKSKCVIIAIVNVKAAFHI